MSQSDAIDLYSKIIDRIRFFQLAKLKAENAELRNKLAAQQLEREQRKA